MPKFDIVVTVTSASATDIELTLNGTEFSLKRNGDTWTGESNITVDGSLKVRFGASGFSGSAWSLKIEVKCKDGTSKTILSKDGTIPAGGPSIFEKTVDLSVDPCGAPSQGGN
jgi:hypothetical protein